MTEGTTYGSREGGGWGGVGRGRVGRGISEYFFLNLKKKKKKYWGGGMERGPGGK